MAITKVDLALESWAMEFAQNLYDTSDWFTVTKNWSSYIGEGANKVHIPQGGAKVSPFILDNSTSLPVAPSTKTMQDIEFDIINIAIAETMATEQKDITNPNVRRELESEILSAMAQFRNIAIGYGIQPDSSTLFTTGTDTRDNVYGKASIKRLTYSDIIAARVKLAQDKADMSNLYMLVDDVMYSDLLLMDQFNRDTTLSDNILTNAVVGSVAGIKVMTRSSGLAYTSLNAKPTAVNLEDGYDATHNSAAMIFDASKVGYAQNVGNMKVDPYANGYFKPVMFGDFRVGASAKYGDYEGLVTIIETT